MRILVTEPIHKAALELLEAHAEVVRWDDPAVADWSDVDGVIVRMAPVTRERLEAAPRLKVVGKHGVGMNTIDVRAAEERGVRLVNTPYGNIESVAELIFAHLLALARQLPAGYDLLRRGAARIAPAELTGLELDGKTLGLVGLGKIALRAAAIGRAGFRMDLLGYDPYVDDALCAEHGIVRCAALEDLLERADFVSVSVPYTPSTAGMIAAPQLARMKPAAVLVNTSRGGVVNEADLFAALSGGKLRAAASDVFEQEPPLPDNPLLQLPNFFGSLHVGASTEEALFRVGSAVAADVLAVLAGREPKSPYPPKK